MALSWKSRVSEEFGQGVVTGLIAALRAYGMSSKEAYEVIVECLPRNYDAACIPEWVMYQ